MVVAIIAILAAMLLPSLSNARRMAKGISCCANLKQQGLIIACYVDDNDGWLLTVDNYYSVNNLAGWKNYLAPYLVKSYNPSDGLSGPWAWTGILRCPELKADVVAPSGKLIYSGGYAWCYPIGRELSNTTNGVRRRLENLAKLSETILTGDSMTELSSSDAWQCSSYFASWSFGSTWQLTNPKHRNGFNNLWADFHCEWRSQNALLMGGPADWSNIPPIYANADYYYFPKSK